jgi:alkylation response protein AidB-like acyl-CoA dehydrogenase
VDLTAEQRDLRDAVRGLLERHRARAAAADGPATPGMDLPAGAENPGYDGALWRRLCAEIGVAGLAIPQDYGGAGAGPVETHIVMEELGRGLTPSPMLGSPVLAAQALLASGDTAACGRLLPGIAAGTTIAALAWADENGHWDPGSAACEARTAAPAAPGWTLTGEAHHVLDGDAADVLLAAARTPDGVALFEVDPRQSRVTRRAVTTMDDTRRLAVVHLDGAAARPVGGAGRAGCLALARARDLACVALTAEQVGAAARALDLTVAYTKVRVQFGRPIGTFQALQHRMADLYVLVDSARSVSYAAASAAAPATAAPATATPATAGDATDLGPLAAAAKAYCSEALTRVAGQMIQLHGAIGITWEHEAHRYFKRAHSAAQLFGRPSEHIARVAAAVLDEGVATAVLDEG